MCEAVISGAHPIQGIVIYPNSAGQLFVNDLVFDFTANLDIRQQDQSHSLQIAKEGIPLENRFPGLYLKNGNHIYNVYGLFNNYTRSLFFVVLSDLPNINENTTPDEVRVPRHGVPGLTLFPLQQMPTGFYYGLDEEMSYEMEGATVSSDFPFVYFSNNVDQVYLYQIPVITFLAPMSQGRDSAGYFAFNSFDRQMEYHQVGGLNKAKNDIERYFMVMRGKMLLRTGFVYNGHIYLITKEAVYVVTQEEMQRNPMPVPVKVPLAQFLVC